MPCEGNGSIPVILLAGGTDPHTVWDDLVDALGSDVLTCRFNPPGIGPSDAPSSPTTASERADVLAQTLNAAGLNQPVVLVAHSLGGQTARQFGARHPDMLAGAVLLDPELSKGCGLHARYLVLNIDHPETQGLGGHDENPKLPGYTPEGQKAGKNSDRCCKQCHPDHSK